MNSIYTRLSTLPVLANNYVLKFLFIAFLGIHIPLIGLIVFIVLNVGALSATTILITTLLLTLIATGITLYTLNNLLEPLKVSKNALQSYLNERKLPELPENFKDEAGVLMQKVQETVIKLDSILEQKKDLIGLLSHDLRTPLVNIKMLSEYIESGEPTPEEVLSMAKMISDSVDRQILLFQEILSILRQEDLSWVKLRLSDITTEDLLDVVMHDMQPLAEKKNIALKINNEIKDKLTVEKNLFPQVIKNLINNAIKFSHKGSQIEVDLKKIGETVIIQVSDHGLGFDMDDSEEIFEKFSKRRKKGTMDEPTTGMGLYLSKKIIEAHHGTIVAKSEGPNKGARFIITL
ncbi:HAMP domain-containing histidine kinase [bacterium]|nr:MAG: HAMP domain-containing histidine kinase [bacterium]